MARRQVRVYTKDLVRDAIACRAEPSRSSACAETPNGDHEPTVYDVQDAQRVKLALDLLAIPQIDYVIWHARLRSPRAHSSLRIRSRNSAIRTRSVLKIERVLS